MDLEGAELGGYVLGPMLGRGGMGTVYRARSTAPGPAGPAGTPVAVKVFHLELREDESTFARFRREAAIGKEIHHPQLVRTYEIGRSLWEWESYDFLVMELVTGQTLSNLLRELGQVPEHLLFAIADQVLGGLEAIHARGVVHQDVKPDNVVVTPEHRVLLMDFGVARRLGEREAATADGVLGSLPYAAPEQLLDGRVGPRTDLYALGVTLFELATGRNPYAGLDPSSVLRQKAEEELPSPRETSPGLSAFWEAVILTAARKSAAERFASATELRQILREGEQSAWWRLRSGGQGGPVAERALRRLAQERTTPFFGREGPLTGLWAAYARSLDGGAALVLAGPVGAGKSRLLLEFLHGVASAGGPSIAAGRGVGEEGRGYGPFVEVLSDLLAGGALRESERREAVDARLRELLPDATDVAPMVDFVLGRIQPDGEHGLTRDGLFATVEKVLARASAARPLVLVVEDLQLAGSETVELFLHLARRLSGHPILFVGVVATDEVASDPVVAEALAAAGTDRTTDVLSLEALGAEAVTEVVRYVVGHEPTVSALAPPIVERGGGNPRVVLELLTHLQRIGRLTPEGEGLRLTGEIDDVPLPSRVRDWMSLAVRHLEQADRETLEAAAVIGPTFSASLLSELTGEPSFDIQQRLALLERKDGLVSSQGRDAFSFSSRPLYETLHEGTPPSRRRDLHGRTADLLLAHHPDPSGRTAFEALRHLLESGRALEASPFLDRALEALSRTFHASFAVPFLDRVSAAFAPAPSSERFRIAMKLWALHEVRGSRDEQMRVLDLAQQMAEETGDAASRARVHACRAGSWWYAGDYDKAEEEARAGLSLAESAGSRHWEATCLHTLGVVAFRRGRADSCHALWRKALAIRREIADRRGQASTLQALSLILPAVGRSEEVLPTQQEALALWRELGEIRGEASMWMNIGNHLVDGGRYEEGMRHLERAIELHRSIGAQGNEAVALVNLGRAQEMDGRIHDAAASLERALSLFQARGDPHGELAAHLLLGSALAPYGETREARSHLQAALVLARKTGVKARLIQAHRELGALLHATGERDSAWSQFEQAIALEDEVGDPSSRVATLLLMSRAALGEQAWERAAELLTEARGKVPEDDPHAALILCRLARARSGRGDGSGAAALAREVHGLLRGAEDLKTEEGPEIYFTLSDLLPDPAERSAYRARAERAVQRRASRITNDAWRETYLKRWS